MSQSRDDQEQAALELMRGHLELAVEVADAADDYVRSVVDWMRDMDPQPAWSKVQSILLTRVADDLRVARLAGVRGYPFASLTLGASAYELTFTAAYVGQDEERAKRWLEWSDYDRPPWKRKAMVEEARRIAFGGDSREEPRYKALCWGKHGNPRMQSLGPVSPTAESHLLNIDPDLGGGAHHLAEFAIWTSLWPMVIYSMVAEKSGFEAPPAVFLKDHFLHKWGRLNREWRESAPEE